MPSTARSAPAASASESARSRRASRSSSPPPIAAHAAPKPTIAGTFSMPARRARSCAPPTTNGGMRSPRRMSKAPAPFGPPNVCAVTEHRSAPSAPKSTGTWPAAAHASTWTTAPAPSRRARAQGHDLVDRLQRADLVVGELHRDEHGVGPDRGRDLVGVEPTEPVDADDGDVVGATRDRVEHGRVLDRGGDDVTPPARSAARRRTARSEDRGVDRLGAAGREDHLPRSGAEAARRPVRARPRSRHA